MKVGRMMLLFFVISWMIIHFGINPDRGGSPPMDRRVARIRTVIMGVLFHVCDNDRVVVVEFLRDLNIGHGDTPLFYLALVVRSVTSW